MATLATLAGQGALVKIDVPLDGHEHPMRLLYCRPAFTTWLEGELPHKPVDRGGRQPPDEQVDDLIHRFVTGEPLADGQDLHPLTPVVDCVWELKTIDVRIFGWFPARDVFVAVNGGMAKRIKDLRMYPGYRDEVRMFRDRLDLDEPKHLQGSRVTHVLSV
jgi:hypothetical protein